MNPIGWLASDWEYRTFSEGSEDHVSAEAEELGGESAADTNENVSWFSILVQRLNTIK